MSRIRERLTSQGITWEQFAFQFVIVLLGVYLAVSFERRVEERGRREDAHEMLGRVLAELRLDEAEIRDVVAEAEGKAAAYDSLSVLMADGSNRFGDEIQSLLFGPLFVTHTVFPRMAAYTAMVSGGYLTAIPDQDLAMRLANLYEHTYGRLVHNGEVVDQTNISAGADFRTQWDYDRRAFLTPGLNGTALARNAMRIRTRVYCDWYAGALLPETLTQVTALRTELEAHLGR